ncbi:MAG: type I DNA topoisomerase [Candidatus Pacebacteria bacterium]|nr:type I DNA topoisomerase [Candidatus Paceibacterota bacterium]
MKKLVIVESPAKAKTIEKYLGKDYVVRASIGHIRDLPKTNKDAIDIPAGFVPRYEISPAKKKVVSDLISLAQKSDEVILATDLDREGEAIAWHLAEALHLKNPKRIVFNEITKEAIGEAIKNPRQVDIKLKEAQEARRVLDRLFGYDLSGLIWKKVRYGLSAGRVQSPALRIIMEREREIRAFIPEDYFVLSGNFSKGSAQFLLKCDIEPTEKSEADRIETLGNNGSWSIVAVKETAGKRNPNAPFTTSTLQQSASTRLGFAPSRTMRVAQKLYEKGHITYMRTDSRNLSGQALGQIFTYIEKNLGKNYLERRVYGKQSKNAQEAHEAIRPTTIASKNAGDTAEEQELYRLIWDRTVASQMASADVLKTKISANIASGDIPNFSINGQQILFPGWLAVDTRSRSEDVELPKLAQGDTINLNKLFVEAKQTTPPNRYSEAGLVKELEKRGIGRPSTYASTINTLVEREYVTKEGRTLIPTDTGDVVSSFVEEYFGHYISDDFTADMETKLDHIADGSRAYIPTLSEFYTPFSAEVASKENIAKITNMGDADAKYVCPKCKASMVIKLGRGGKFLSCGTYPDCDGALTIDGKEIRAEEPLGIHPETKLPIYVMNGRYGPYVQMGESPKIPKKTTFPKGHKKTDEEKEMLKQQAAEIKSAKELPRPKMASIPHTIIPENITIDQAVHLLVLPRTLGAHPDDNEPVIANIGKFGPYIGHNRDFRSIKKTEKFTPYDITLEQALHLLNQAKSLPKGVELFKNLGKHPKTGKDILLLKSKSGFYMQKGLKRIWLDDKQDPGKFTVDDAVKML